MIYALGSHLPAPINLWGPVPSTSKADDQPSVVQVPYGGTKAESVQWLKRHQKAVEDAGSVLVVGGGALGIREYLISACCCCSLRERVGCCGPE